MKTYSSSQPFCFLSRIAASATFLGAVATLAAMAVFASPLHAQAAAAVPAGTRVAVIDISYIFKNHPGFKASMEAMKLDVQAFEAKLRSRGEDIKKLQAQLPQFNPTSPDYKRIEGQIVQINADGQAAATLKKKDFLQQEAAIYFATYTQIVNEVAALSEKHGIGLVVRFNSEPITEDRQAILEGVNRAVVYQKHLNITKIVLESLTRSYAAAAGAAPAARTAAPGVAAPR